MHAMNPQYRGHAIDQWAISIRQRLAQEVELGVERVEVFGREGPGSAVGWSGWSRRVPGIRID